MSPKVRGKENMIVILLIITAVYTVSSSSNEIDLLQRKTFHFRSPEYNKISVNITPSMYRFLMVQTVVQLNNVSLSYSETLKYGSHINSTSAGLIYMLRGGETNIISYLAAPRGSFKAQVVAVPFSRKDPIPGGCCITCAFDNDPNIYIKTEMLTVKVHFGRGNIYFDPGKTPDSCDGGTFSTFRRLQYDLFVYQLRENDFSEDGLFDATWKMSTPGKIKYYGRKIGTVEKSERAIFVLQTIPDQGVVYNILLRDIELGTESCYSPKFFYGCDITDISTCHSFGSTTTIVYAVLFGIVGLLLCFFGHKFLTTELFIGGMISGFIISYILILRFATLNYTAQMLASTAVGIFTGILILALYLGTKLFHPIFIINGHVIGFIIACSVLFSPIGQLKTFSSNTVYLLTFLSIMMSIPIPLVFFPKLNSILFSSLVGGYAVVVACSVFMHANIQYIVVEFVLRAGIPSFADAYLRVPFQENEYILCGVWGFLLVTGAACQYVLTRKEQFPPASKLGTRSNGRWRWFRRRRGTTRRMFDERTPLLQNENIQHNYGSETPLQSKQEPINVA